MDLEQAVKATNLSYVEGREHLNEMTSIVMMNGQLLGLSKESYSGYALRGYENGVLYFSSSKSVEGLKLVKVRADGWERLDDVEVSSGSYEVRQRKAFDSMPLDEKVKFLKDLYLNLSKLDVKSKILNFTVNYMESVEQKRVLFHDGSEVRGRVPRVWIYFSLVMKYQDRTATVWSDEFGASGGLEWLENWKIEERLKEKIREVDEVLVKGKAIKEGKYDVVLGPMLAGIMAHESVGHPFEADRVLGREAAQAGLSYLTYMKEKRIGSEAVTVIDDPTLPNSNGFFLIDDEGVKARPKVLIKKGEVNELLQNRFSAPKFNAKSNGSARAMSYNREPIIRMSNTFFQPGNMTLEELLEDVKEGIYFKSYMEWNIDDLRLGERYVGLQAYEIRDGEVKDPVLFPVLEGKTNELLAKVDGASNRLQFFAGVCGKGDPDQGVPVWMGGPDLRLRDVYVKVI